MTLPIRFVAFLLAGWVAALAGAAAAQGLPARRPAAFEEALEGGSFAVRQGGGTVTIGSASALASVARESASEAALVNIHWSFTGARTEVAAPEPVDPRPAVHHFRRREPRDWRPARALAPELRVEGVRPGVDLRWYFGAHGLEYDLELGEGADAAALSLRIDGADSLHLTEGGDLEIECAGEALRHRAPEAYAIGLDGVRSPVPCAYRLLGPREVGLTIGAAPAGSRLVVDPGIVYATYFGGGILDVPDAIAVDSQGYTSITGRTAGGFPTTPGALMPTFGGAFWGDAFLTRFTPDLGALVFSTYMGGSWNDWGRSVQADAAGNVAIGVEGGSPEMPLTPGCFSPFPGGAYVAKVTPAGDGVLAATHFGSLLAMKRMQLSPEGDFVLCGLTYEGGMPSFPGVYSPFFNGGWLDAFAARIDASAASVKFATYLGGASGGEFGLGLALTSKGAVIVTGETTSPDFPITPGAYQPTIVMSDWFIARLSADGSKLERSTFLGDNAWSIGGNERAIAAAVDEDDFVYVLGTTIGPAFPPGTFSYDTGFNPNVGYQCLVKMSPDLGQLLYTIRLGSIDQFMPVAAWHLRVDEQGCAVVAGCGPPTFPTTANAIPYLKGKWEAFLIRFSPLGTALTYSTLFGTALSDGAVDAAIDSSGNAHVLGGTESVKFPVTPGAYSKTPNLADNWDIVIAKFEVPRVPYGTSTFGTGKPGCRGEHLLRTEKGVEVGDPSVEFLCTRAPKGSQGLLLLSDAADPTGPDALYTGLPIYVGLTSSLAAVDLFTTGDSSLGRGTLVLPNLTPLVGQTFHAQAFWLWSANDCWPSTFGLSASNGLSITVLP